VVVLLRIEVCIMTPAWRDMRDRVLTTIVKDPDRCFFIRDRPSFNRAGIMSPQRGVPSSRFG
jgi:hypothetical protein